VTLRDLSSREPTRSQGEKRPRRQMATSDETALNRVATSRLSRGANGGVSAPIMPAATPKQVRSLSSALAPGDGRTPPHEGGGHRGS
jgi:hypothetical protein